MMFDHMLRRLTEQRRKIIRARQSLLFCQKAITLKTARWTGDDYPGDPNGYGHVSGEEDGDTRDQDDCELWFDITQNDYDGDGLTWWQEVRERAPGEEAYGTDPTAFTDDDVDWDGLTG
ncbi:MAG: hypothetical protein FP824_05880, partial [Euryarchaeota archaeon]|nr:hypothetical protein [Euryarchaeota archaeon]